MMKSSYDAYYNPRVVAQERGNMRIINDGYSKRTRVGMIVKVVGYRDHKDAWLIARVQSAYLLKIIEVCPECRNLWIVGDSYGCRDLWTTEIVLSLEEALLYDL